MRDQDELIRALTTLGHVLEDRGCTAHIPLIGGSALLLAGEGNRPTGDVDVVAVATGDQPLSVSWRLPEEIVHAATDVAGLLGLAPDWLNAGAAGVLEGRVPEQFEQRLRSRAYGSLVVSVPVARISSG